MRRTVLLVDDHAEFRHSARALLEAEGFDVVAEASDGAGALVANERAKPAIVLLDIQLSDLDGFTVAKRLALGPDPPAVVLTSGRDARTFGARLRTAAVRGFIAKRDLSGAALARLVG
jgi:DNA-binding NarL/FixJ family response regulator